MSTRPDPVVSMLRGIGVGLASLALLTAIKVLLRDTFGEPTPFLLYFLAVLAASWVGGVWAGGVTTVAATLVALIVFVPRHYALGLSLLRGGAFLFEGASIAFILGRIQTVRRSLVEAAAEARTARDKLGAVLDAVDDGVTVQDRAGVLLYANAAAARMTGFASADELLRTPSREVLQRFALFGEDGAPFPLERLPARRVFAGDPPGEEVVRFTLAGSGEEHWSLVRAWPVRHADGDIRFAVNVFRDITLARAQEDALRSSRAWLSTALESIGDAVITTDARGKVTFLNPIAAELTGWTPGEAEGLPLRDVFVIFDEETRQPLESPVARVLGEGAVVALANHTVLRRRDGSELAIDDSAAPIRDRAGAVEGVILVFRDVSRRRQDEHQRAFLERVAHELSTSLDYEATLATIARLAVPTIADWCAVDMRDGDGVKRLAIAHVDPAKLELVADLVRRWPPDPAREGAVQRILRTGTPELLSEIPPELIAAAQRDEEHGRVLRQLELRSFVGVPILRGGEPIGVISFVMAESRRRYDAHDLAQARIIAERASIAVENALLYREAAAARAEAELASRAKDEFLAILGHELRNPLAPIVTALQLMDLRGDSTFASERQIIGRQVKHVVRLVDDLLDLSRVTGGRIELAREPIAIADVVARAVEMCQPLLEERKHTLTREIAPDLVVIGDAVRLAQIVSNLLTNAAKYTPPGGRIAIQARRDGGEAVLTVRDNGSGIAPELLPRVFDMFVQGEQELDRARGGLGLGLTIVRTLVERHGGSVTLHSEGADRGTEVTVRLPLAAAPALPAPVPSVTPPAPATRALVLVVDDNEDARELLIELLEAWGHRALGAGDGPAALALIERERPDVALVDIGLPGMDGFAVAEALRARPELASLRLIALTGYGQASDRARSSAAGFDEHLTKPVSAGTLRAALKL